MQLTNSDLASMQQMILTTDVDAFSVNTRHTTDFLYGKANCSLREWCDMITAVLLAACSVLQTPFKCCWVRYTTDSIECMHLLPTSLSSGSQQAATVWGTTDCITTGIGLHADFTAGRGTSFEGHRDRCRGAHCPLICELHSPHSGATMQQHFMTASHA